MPNTSVKVGPAPVRQQMVPQVFETIYFDMKHALRNNRKVSIETIFLLNTICELENACDVGKRTLSGYRYCV